MKIQDIGGSFLWEERKGNTIGQKDTQAAEVLYWEHCSFQLGDGSIDFQFTIF